MRTTLRIDDQLARRAKRQAADEGITLTALIERALRESLSRPSGEGESGGELPASRNRGGLRPGVDLGDGPAVRELMDAGGR